MAEEEEIFKAKIDASAASAALQQIARGIKSYAFEVEQAVNVNKRYSRDAKSVTETLVTQKDAYTKLVEVFELDRTTKERLLVGVTRFTNGMKKQREESNRLTSEIKAQASAYSGLAAAAEKLITAEAQAHAINRAKDVKRLTSEIKAQASAYSGLAAAAEKLITAEAQAHAINRSKDVKRLTSEIKAQAAAYIGLGEGASKAASAIQAAQNKQAITNAAQLAAMEERVTKSFIEQERAARALAAGKALLAQQDRAAISVASGLASLRRPIPVSSASSAASAALFGASARANASRRGGGAGPPPTPEAAGPLFIPGFGSLTAANLASIAVLRLSSAVRQATGDTIDFARQVSMIQTLSQEAPLAYGKWADSIRKIAVEFNRPELDVAAGTYQAISNQVGQGAESLEFMTQAARLARLTMSSTRDSVDTLSSIIKAYGLNASEAGDLSNKLWKAADLGRFTLKDVASELGNVSAAGRPLGITIEEILASFSAITIQGVNTETSLTNLQNVFIRILKPGPDLLKFFNELGFSSGVQAVQTLKLVGVIKLLDKEFQKAPERVGELFHEFRAFRGALQLTGEGLKFVETNLKGINNAAGGANEALKIIEANHGERISSMGNKIKTAFSEAADAIIRYAVASKDAASALFPDSGKTETNRKKLLSDPDAHGLEQMLDRRLGLGEEGSADVIAGMEAAARNDRLRAQAQALADVNRFKQELSALLEAPVATFAADEKINQLRDSLAEAEAKARSLGVTFKKIGEDRNLTSLLTQMHPDLERITQTNLEKIAALRAKNFKQVQALEQAEKKQLQSAQNGLELLIQKLEKKQQLHERVAQKAGDLTRASQERVASGGETEAFRARQTSQFSQDQLDRELDEFTRSTIGTLPETALRPFNTRNFFSEMFSDNEALINQNLKKLSSLEGEDFLDSKVLERNNELWSENLKILQDSFDLKVKTKAPEFEIEEANRRIVDHKSQQLNYEKQLQGLLTAREAKEHALADAQKQQNEDLKDRLKAIVTFDTVDAEGKAKFKTPEDAQAAFKALVDSFLEGAPTEIIAAAAPLIGQIKASLFAPFDRATTNAAVDKQIADAKTRGMTEAEFSAAENLLSKQLATSYVAIAVKAINEADIRLAEITHARGLGKIAERELPGPVQGITSSPRNVPQTAAAQSRISVTTLDPSSIVPATKLISGDTLSPFQSLSSNLKAIREGARDTIVPFGELTSKLQGVRDGVRSTLSPLENLSGRTPTSGLRDTISPFDSLSGGTPTGGSSANINVTVNVADTKNLKQVGDAVADAIKRAVRVGDLRF